MNVLFYARYSTDRQNDVSIETQIELGKEFIEKRGWKLIDVFKDHAVSGTLYKTRPGIQALLRRAREGDINIILCVTLDRISRDAEHGNGFLKRIRYLDAELWTVQGNAAVNDIEMALRVTLSQELIEQIRYRTREGMKTAVSKGKATTCLAYGYRVRLAYDASGDRIPGLRTIDEHEAKVIRRIYSDYAKGTSPRDIAKALNDEGIPGPRSLKWRDTAIRGHVTRGTGILNNETYIGRIIWNKRNYRKNPDTEKRNARHNEPDAWVTTEASELRIIDDTLWNRVKAKQREVNDLFAHTATNHLNAAHRPSYLLSGLLECAECSGPYAIMAKDRYGCTNHKKRLPIDALDGACCSNQKTILRQDIETRVLACVNAAFLQLGVIEKIKAQAIASLTKKIKATPNKTAEHKARLKALDIEQKNIIQQISERMREGRPRLSALDDMLDELERERELITKALATIDTDEPDTLKKLEELNEQINPSNVKQIVDLLVYHMREHADTETKQPFISIVRQLIQKVVITKTPGHQPASLEVHGRIASILAAMEASSILEERFKMQKLSEQMELEDKGVIDCEAKRQAFIDAYEAELDMKKEEWKNIQVSVVAGAGFEPAAFRL